MYRESGNSVKEVAFCRKGITMWGEAEGKVIE